MSRPYYHELGFNNALRACAKSMGGIQNRISETRGRGKQNRKDSEQRAERAPGIIETNSENGHLKEQSGPST